ncbi:MAG: AAA family ATPase [bacterium]|nr:AAA family ATPase [bacterium]
MTDNQGHYSSEMDDEAGLKRLSESVATIRRELAQIIVGQQEVIEQLLISMLAGGHCILVGVPGLAKTLLISSLAKAIDLKFSRIQFTPDLMPADITGTEVIQEDQATGRREFRFIPGPIFANVILADEINRTPPKTQAALLEAMQEKQVTSGGQRHALPSPFFVLATQNPIEQEGTYPLPEAQLDRFMFNVKVDYPSQDDEVEIVLRTTSDLETQIHSTISGGDLSGLSHLVRRIAITPSLALIATQIARLTRPENFDMTQTDSEIARTPKFRGQPVHEMVQRCVRWGAGPRASQYIVLGAKARAAMHGSPVVRREDIEAVAPPALRHRIKLNFQAEADGVTVDNIIQQVIDAVDASIASGSTSEQISKVLRS